METTYVIRIENHFAGRAYGKLYEGEFVMWEITRHEQIQPGIIIETMVDEGAAETEELAIEQAQAIIAEKGV